MKILRTASLGSNFTGSYKKRVYLDNILSKIHEENLKLFSRRTVMCYESANSLKLLIIFFKARLMFSHFSRLVSGFDKAASTIVLLINLATF